MPRAAVTALALALAALAGQPAAAFEPLGGYFIALEACTTGRSIAQSREAGQPETEIRRAYDILGQNRAEPTHFQIRMPEIAAGPDRWVAVDCGVHAVAQATASPPPDDRRPPHRGRYPLPPVTTESTDNLLVASWQPAFCETAPGRGKTECRALNAGETPRAASHFSIHGLWPQPNGTFWCGVDPDHVNQGRWERLPEPETDGDTARELAEVMPGVASNLHRHEWIKHGSCYGAEGGADEYYDDTLWLMEQLNASAVQDLFEANIGARITLEEIRAAFDDSFGAGAGDRVRLKCSSGNIQELWIHMDGVIVAGDTPLGDLMRAARPVTSRCSSGHVDPAGL